MGRDRTPGASSVPSLLAMLVMLLVLCALSRRDGTLWNVLSLAMDGARDPTIFPRSDDVLRVDGGKLKNVLSLPMDGVRDPTIFPRSDDVLRVDDDDPARDVLRVDDRRDW